MRRTKQTGMFSKVSQDICMVLPFLFIVAWIFYFFFPCCGWPTLLCAWLFSSVLCGGRRQTALARRTHRRMPNVTVSGAAGGWGNRSPSARKVSGGRAVEVYHAGGRGGRVIAGVSSRYMALPASPSLATLRPTSWGYLPRWRC